MIIINGRTGSDRDIGDVTFQGHNGNSTIDYCITSPDMIPHIQDFQVDLLDKNLSDKHSPIILKLKTKQKENPGNQNETSHETDINYEQINSKWSDEKKSEFQSNFDQNKINDLYQTLDNIEINSINQTKIDEVVKQISNISITAGKNTNMSKKITNNKSPTKNTKKDKPWFDNECRLKRKHFLQIKRRLIRKRSKSNIDTKILNHEAKMYKRLKK